jgi:hypothetical protein
MKCIKSNKSMDIFMNDTRTNNYLFGRFRVCVNCKLKICKNFKLFNNIRDSDSDSYSSLNACLVKEYDGDFITCDDFELNRYVY